MDERSVPDLEEMDELEARRFLSGLFSRLSAEGEYEIRHAGYVMEMPQSGERIRGRENMREFQRAFGENSTPPNIRIGRVVVRDGLWVVESVNDYGGGRVFNVLLVIELKDGKMFRDTRYYCEFFDPPEWRAHLVERMEDIRETPEE